MVAPLGEISDLASSFDEMSLAVYVRQHELQESEKKYRALIDQSGDAIFLQSVNKLLIINPRFTEIFGVAPAQLDEESRTIVDFSTESSRNYVTQMMNRLGQGEINRLRFEFSALSNLGTEIEVEVNASTFPYLGDFAIQGILRDITDRKKIEREEREQRVLAEALRDTASALNSTLNLDEVMDRILENTKLVVPHESSSIMLVEETPAYAKIVAVKGYVGLGMEIWAQNARFQIQKTPTLAAMFNTGRPVAIPDVVTDATWISISEYDWIRSYIGAPIKVKDSIIGFLNLESPIPGYFNLRQAERLQAFADQAGIAIHNAKLLSELTRTNQDLIMAYETTLQGWSKALEIRDYETHGHTMRVLEQTIKLARWIGIPPEDIRNIKYGVLLHDIGKLFIPENILNKKHSLTDEEWRIMRQHPSYAFEVLSPISFLSSSIDIPYCHHEHWDGSGYPRGLKGNQIPLAARIFSIIDIWDALTNDRPYRTKWQYNQTMEYIQGLSGQILDPAIVQAFNEMMSSESNQEGI
jgi:PAS domain S-box-containing protein